MEARGLPLFFSYLGGNDATHCLRQNRRSVVEVARTPTRFSFNFFGCEAIGPYPAKKRKKRAAPFRLLMRPQRPSEGKGRQKRS